MKRLVAGHWKLTTTNWEPSSKLILLQLHKKLPKNSTLTILLLFGIWSRLKRWKKLNKGMPCEMTTNQKKCYFEVSSSLILHNNKPFFNQIVMCDEKWILDNNQRWPVQWLDLEEAPKHFPKPNLHPKKGQGHCLVVCCPSDLLQLSESQWNHFIWEECLANLWDSWKTAMPVANTGQQKGPSSSPW